MGNRGFQSFEMPGFEAHLDDQKRTAMRKVNDMVGAAYEKGGSSVLPTMYGLPTNAPTPGNVNSAAQFTIQVKRVSATLATQLPVMLFDPIDLPSGYRRSLAGAIPAGIQLDRVVAGGVGFEDKAVFTYTDGVDTDTVEVTCTTAPYPAFLQSLITDRFDLNKIRISLSDPAQVAQFSNELQFWTKSMFGLGSTVPVVPENFRSPQQYQSGIVDVDVEAKFDKQSGIIVPMNPVIGLVVSLNCFSPRFYQQSARYW